MGMKLEGRKLVITLSVKDPRPSTSGKSLIVASTRGTRKSKLTTDGIALYYSANVFTKRESRRKSKLGTKQPARHKVS